MNDDQRFDAKWHLDEETGCHVWDNAKVKGYGRFWYKGRAVYAHVFAWARAYGPVPEGLVLDHFKCDRKDCCNKDHVRPASNRENTMRGTAGDYQRAKTHCPKGHEYTEENTKRDPEGHRKCRICHNSTSNKGWRERRARNAER